MTYPVAFRKKVLAHKEKEGLTLKETSKRFLVGTTTISCWKKNLEPKAGRNKPATKIDMHLLQEDVAHSPDAYQYERAQRLGVSQPAICSALRRLGITYKKNAHSSQSRRRKAQRVPKSDQGVR